MKRLLLITIVALLSFNNAQAQIFSEDFNAGIPATFTLTDVDGMTSASTVITGASAFSAATIANEACAGSVSWFSPIGQADDWMVTPAITLPNTINGIGLQFDAAAFEAAFPDGVEVYVSTTGTSPADFTGAALYNSTPTIPGPITTPIPGNGENDTWTTRAVSLTSYVGQTIYIAFRNNSDDMHVLGIDNIIVRELVDNDVEVVSANIDAIIAGNRTANLIVKNIGGNNVTSLNADYTWNGTTTPINITGINLTTGQTHTETISLGSLNVGGPYPFSATITTVNSTTDPDMSNNSISTDYTIVEAIPNWTMTDSYGNSITLHDELAAGKMVVLDFMASWCSPCQSSTPELNTLYENHTTAVMDNINVFGITVEATDNTSVMNNLNWGGTYPKFPYTAENDAQYFHYGATLGLNTGGSIPFFVMICPNKTDPGNSTIVQSDVGFTSGMFNSNYETKFGACPSADNTAGSTEINESISKFSIYPNPVKDVLTIEGSYTSVDIFDVFGKLVLSADATKTINIQSLADGVYMLTINTEKGIQTKKITITK